MKRICWKPEKNEWLKETREISFEQLVDAWNAGGLKGWDFYSGTKSIHRNQILLYIEVDDSLWTVPATVSESIVLLRTAYEEE